MPKLVLQCPKCRNQFSIEWAQGQPEPKCPTCTPEELELPPKPPKKVAKKNIVTKTETED